MKSQPMVVPFWSPGEVEAALAACPGVRAAAVAHPAVDAYLRQLLSERLTPDALRELDDTSNGDKMTDEGAPAVEEKPKTDR